MRAIPPNSENCIKNFQVIEAFDVKAKKILQCKSTQLLKELILLKL